ncbi:hypothetical protein DXB65_11520 [Bacteroides oleiciplenus]|uniref:Uncharacterized protein n=1 Tax=Bacteroides oleiciplenus TaxID=626931 RepID=A0A3E5BCH2_9BACE|nr:hypothetical protein DXB65_11520 [Bacteroides oleiciplenus]
MQLILDMKKDVKKGVHSLKWCYKGVVPAHGTCYSQKNAYLCTVFFIVLDLRLTKVGVQRCSFFYAHIPYIPLNRSDILNFNIPPHYP